MYCPECGSEYREGFLRCADCEVDLVEQPPQPQQVVQRRFVTVLRAGDPAVLLMARSLLQGAGIECFGKGEGLQDLFALGRLGTGFNPLIGPAQIQVSEEDEAAAREVLQGLEEASATGGLEEEDEEEEDGGEGLEVAEEPSVVEATDADDLPEPSERDRNVFRALIVAQLLAVVLGIGLTYRQDPIPGSVFEQIDAIRPPLLSSETLAGSYFVWMGLSVVASLGMFLFWSSSRYFYLAAQAGYLAYAALGPAGVGGGLPSFFSGVEILLSGAILALAFSSPIRGAFERRGRAPA